MQALDIRCRRTGDLLGRGDDIEGIGGRVDDGCAGDTDFRSDVVGADVAVRDGRHALGGVDEGVLPEVTLRGVVPLGVEGIDAIMLRGDEKEVVRPLGRDGDPGLDQGLGVDVTVGR